MQMNKATVKRVLGELPLAAELYWQIRQNGKPLSKSFSLSRTQSWLPTWRRQAEAAARLHPQGKNILLFATLRYWIEHAVLMGLGLAGLGHRPTLAILPYANWRKAVNRFDLRRHNIYSRKVLEEAGPLLNTISLLDLKPAEQSPGKSAQLPQPLRQAIHEVSLRDVQYTLQREEVDLDGHLFRLRLERNTQAAQSSLMWMQSNRLDVVLTPNGSILEMGAIYQVARYLEIPVVTYEFGEQQGRIWLAQNGEVMRQDTDALWAASQHLPLTEGQLAQARALYTSRQRADLWENFSRRWQGLPSQGGQAARAALQLDQRPVVLLAANVIGDSLTLGRQVFTRSMTEWLQYTVTYFAEHPEVQLVVRIHPGERYTQGPSVAEVVRQVLPELPGNIYLVAADDPINTYDLMEIADLGLVYTTTVGMEMAMGGVPVIVVGQTHYRDRGFTLDPDSWEAYQRMLEQALSKPGDLRLLEAQVKQAWNYAYRFFFEYPQPFPWHLLHFWDELKTWSLERVVSAQGQEQYGDAFRYLTGEPINWAQRSSSAGDKD